MVLVISLHDSHERFTRSDREVEARIEEHVDGEAVVRHFIRADPD